MKPSITFILLLMLLCLPVKVQGQAAPDTTFDLAQVASGAGWAVFNRSLSVADAGERQGLYLDEKPGQGVAWLPSLELGDGVIEVDLKGRNEPGSSFVGLAFRGVNAEHYEAIYLRPFNFKADTEVSRSRSVQYVLVPSHEWRRLRTQHPGQYEAAITPPPEPDSWVHLRVELEGPTVRVFVNRAPEPTLVVDRIGAVEKGWVGLWVGHNSNGTFANLKISPI